MRWLPIALAGLLLAVPSVLPSEALAQDERELSQNVQMDAVAVARTQSGETVGAVATISVSISTQGDGRVHVDTKPLTGTDMQGSARIAARVASSLTGYALDEHDFYFVVRSDSPVISGPSAGSVMALAATVALENTHREQPWELNREVMVTGTINPDGTIGPVGGIREKARAAAQQGAGLFLVPEGQATLAPRGNEDPVEVSNYCENELGIECREVGHIKELVRLSTGYAFLEPELGEPPTTAGYEQTLRPLADELIERGRLFEEVWDALNTSSVSAEASQQILASIRGAQGDVQRAEANVAAERFYSAASRAFTAAIQARHAQLLFTYHDNGQDEAIVEDAIQNASQAVDEAREAASGLQVEGMQSLYTIGAAQQRVSDGEEFLEDARSSWNTDPSASAAFVGVAQAIERSATVHWWLQLGQAFGPGPDLPSSVEQISEEMMDLADEMIAYTAQVLANRQPREAAETMQKARENAQRGFHAGAAIQAAEAQTVAALAVELRAGPISEEKLDTSRAQAVRAIQQARGLEVEPILPIALFEFGGVQEADAASIRFYRTASVLAGMSSTLEVSTDPTPVEHVGAWEGGDIAAPVGHTYRSVAAGWFVVGFFGTIILALFAVAISDGDRASNRSRPPG